MLTPSRSTIHRTAVASLIALTACHDGTGPAPWVPPNNPPTPSHPSPGLNITVASNVMVIGSLQRLWASRIASGQSITAVKASWSSSNPTVLTVDTLGFATAIGVGQAVVTATVGSEYTTREISVIRPPGPSTSNALIVDEFSMIEFQQPGSTLWEYAPQMRVHTETGRDVAILSITFSIPGLRQIPSWGCLAAVPSAPSELNGIVYGDWASSITGSQRATSTEVMATIVFLDDLVAIETTTAKGRIVGGSVPTIYFDENKGGLCYRQFLPPS